jgi:hypothetical protein
MKIKCNCTYDALIKRGFHPIDHAWSCPLNKDFVEVVRELKEPKPIKIKRENNPYKEIKYKDRHFKDFWLSEEDEKKFNKYTNAKKKK